jgi:hypothetical protein
MGQVISTRCHVHVRRLRAHEDDVISIWSFNSGHSHSWMVQFIQLHDNRIIRIFYIAYFMIHF